MSTRQTASVNQASDANGELGDRSVSGSGGDNVDKIRELLFGQQMVGYEARFSQLESKLTSEAEALRRSLESNIAELRSFFEKRTNDVEKASVARLELAGLLEQLATKLRG